VKRTCVHIVEVICRVGERALWVVEPMGEPRHLGGCVARESCDKVLLEFAEKRSALLLVPSTANHIENVPEWAWSSGRSYVGVFQWAWSSICGHVRGYLGVFRWKWGSERGHRSMAKCAWSGHSGGLSQAGVSTWVWSRQYGQVIAVVTRTCSGHSVGVGLSRSQKSSLRDICLTSKADTTRSWPRHRESRLTR
jgi:hypothetical protein